MIQSGGAQTKVDLDAAAAKTDHSSLPYPVQKIVVRGFDGNHPPPRLVEPERPLFYGYGMTAYYHSTDSLIFFKIQKLTAEHRDDAGNVIKSFILKGNRYSDTFKQYYLKTVPASERKNFFLRDVYVKDKKGNYLKLDKEFKLCHHCQ